MTELTMVRLRTLGECVIEVGENRIGPDSKVVFGLLLYLGLERGKRVPRTTLMDLFWPDSSPDRAAHSLRQTIYQCRKLGAQIEASKTEVTLENSDIASDLDHIEAAGEGNSWAPGAEFLPGYKPDGSDAFVNWLDQHRSVVSARIRHRLLLAMARSRSSANWESASAIARQLLDVDPLNEEGTLVLAEATAMRGNKADALHILDDFAKDVGHNLQLTLPSNVLRRRIAEHFKDIGSAQPLVGRSEVLDQLSTRLTLARQREGGALLLWGPPGIGKSRLLVEVEANATLAGFQVCGVACHLVDASRPLSAFTEAVPRLIQLRGALGCSPESLELLRRLVRVHSDPKEWSRDNDGIVDPTNVRRALLELLDSIVAEAPLLIAVEDVHWPQRTDC